MNSKPIWQMSAADTAAKIRAKELSAVDAVGAAIDRMGAVNDSVNAVSLSLADAAMAAAEHADTLVANGSPLGPLHGVPVTIKENIDQEGIANTNGLPAFAEQIATADSPVSRNLKNSGAIVIGCTNTPEFSYRWFTDNPLRGRTLNPWHHGHTPGGSSGGAAAAVALGIGAIAHGNDLGGSLRYPAYACGCATIKPGLGRVGSYNPSAAEERPPSLQLMSVQGPITRTVADSRLGLEVMAQADHRDPWWVPAPLVGPSLGDSIKVAVSYGPHHVECAPEVRAAVDTAADHLSNAGYAVEHLDPPHLEEAAERWRTLLGADTREMMMLAMREYGSERIGELATVFCESGAADLASYMRLTADRTRIWREWAEFMQSHPLILAPVSQQLPFPQGADEQGAAAYRDLIEQQTMLFVVNVLGLPSAAVPTGLVGDLPVGVQIIGPRFREDACLDAAEAIESGVGILVEQLWAREA